MRVNPIRMGAVPYQARYTASNTREKFNNTNTHNNSGYDEVSFGSLNLSRRDVDKIVETIKDTDDARLDGSKLGLYRYADEFMVKAPDTSIRDTAMKEFYALTRIHKFDNSCSAIPTPAILSRITADRPFLVEEFIPGKLNTKGRYSLTQANAAMHNLLIMDQSGIISQDLSPSNTIYIPQERSLRFVDFDTFSFIGDSGRIRHSQSTPSALFKTFIDNLNIPQGEGRVLYQATDAQENEKIKEMFAKSFTFRRRNPEGFHHLLTAANMSDNPYINVPSNLTNYESRTIFTKIMAGEVDAPADFLRDYLQIKGRNYHASMRDFLQSLSIPDMEYELAPDRYSLDEARERLQKAIDYEDFLSKLFEKKPDKYFAKLQAAKMQLNALLFHENLDRNVPNYEQLVAAYRNLLDIISEGIYDYREPEYQRFLNAEMDRYTEVFSHSDFLTSRARQPISDTLDILSTWFSDIDKDPMSFSIMRKSAKEAIREAMAAVCRDLDDYNLTPDQVKARYGSLAASISTSILEPIKDSFIDSQFEVENVKIINEALDEFTRHDLKKLAEQAREAALQVLEEAQGTARNAARKAVLSPQQLKEQQARRIAQVSRHLPSPEAAISSHTKEYAKQRYIYQGGNMLLKAGIAAALTGIGIFEYFSYKKRHQNVTLVTNPKNDIKNKKMPVICEVTSGENSPFKQFSI